jgi:hypothetical protein
MKAGLIHQLKHGEKGQILIITLAALLLGAMLIPATLGFMQTGIKAGKVIETRAIELYAADAGVESAIMWMKINALELPGAIPEVIYTPGAEPVVNGHSVEVIISSFGDGTGVFKIESNSRLDSVTKTKIEAYVQQQTDAIDFTKNAITSPGNVILRPGVDVYGDVVYGGNLDNKGIIYDENGAPLEEDPLATMIPNWPNTPERIEQVSDFYLDDVDPDDLWIDEYIDDKDKMTVEDLLADYPLGPLSFYRNGNLYIDSKNPADLTLNGTVYIDGDLEFLQSGSNNITVDLNSQTIYVNGDFSAFSNVNFIGQGAIIALGDINFQPNSSSNDFLFLMSITGKTTLSPGGDFVGSVAGAAEVYLSSGSQLIWEEPPTDLNIPDWEIFFGLFYYFDILAWDISVY